MATTRAGLTQSLLKGIIFVWIPSSDPYCSKLLAKNCSCFPVAVMQGIMVSVMYLVVNISRCGWYFMKRSYYTGQ